MITVWGKQHILDYVSSMHRVLFVTKDRENHANTIAGACIGPFSCLSNSWTLLMPVLFF